MRNLILEILQKHLKRHSEECSLIDFADRVAREIVASPRFTELQAQRISLVSEIGCREDLNLKWRIAMSALTDAMTALGALIAANNSPETAAHLAAIDTHLSSIDAKQGSDEATIADTTAGLQALVTAAQGAPAATPAPVPDGTAPTA